MPGIKIVQLRWENEGWFRILNFLKQENVYLKNRLAYILDNIEKEQLPVIEQFQNIFINNDTLLAILGQEITSQQKLLFSKIKKEEGIEDVLSQQNKLRKDVNNMEKEFCNIRNGFNNYLADNIRILN